MNSMDIKGHTVTYLANISPAGTKENRQGLQALFNRTPHDRVPQGTTEMNATKQTIDPTAS
jgi:hypothetical protein